MIVALLALIAAIFGSGSAKGAGAAGWTPPDKAGLNLLRELGERAGLTELQIAFFALVAYGESRFNNLVGLGRPELFPQGTQPNLNASTAAQDNESDAAFNAYDRNRALFEGCGHPPAAYGFGSGGWFGMLPANGLAQLKGTPLVCLSPYAVFDPIAALVMAYGFARGLQGWSQFQMLPTVANLRAMWGWPAKGGDPAYLASKREKFEAHAKAIGLGPGFLDSPIPRLPKVDLAAMYHQLSAGVS